jgi:hypothetical protein
MTHGRARRLTVILVVMLGSAGICASAANGFWYWVEQGSTIKANTAILGAGKTFRLRTSIREGASKIVIECSKSAFLSGGVIFNGTTFPGKIEVGQGQAELELKECKPTSVCSEVRGGVIKIPTGGNADWTIALTGSVEKFYVDTLPNAGEFAAFTLMCSGTPLAVKIYTLVGARGFDLAEEGRGGLLAQVDSNSTEATTERTTHLLKYECAGEQQTPRTAKNGEGELIEVDRLTFEFSACIEGEVSLSLESGRGFNLL